MISIMSDAKEKPDWYFDLMDTLQIKYGDRSIQRVVTEAAMMLADRVVCLEEKVAALEKGRAKN